MPVLYAVLSWTERGCTRSDVDWGSAPSGSHSWGVSLHSEKMESVVPAQLIQTGHLCPAGREHELPGDARRHSGTAGGGDHPSQCPNFHCLSPDLAWDFSALSNWNRDVDTELKQTILLASRGATWRTWSSEEAESSCA